MSSELTNFMCIWNDNKYKYSSNDTSIKKIYKSWYIIRINNHSFLYHLDDIITKDSTKFKNSIGMCEIYVTKKELDKINCIDKVYQYKFKHKSTTGGATIKYTSNKNAIYIPEIYFLNGKLSG